MRSPLHDSIVHFFGVVQDKDLAAVLACLADDVVFVDPHYPEPRMAGKAAIATGLRWAFNTIRSFEFTEVNYYEAADGRGAAIEMASNHVLKTGKRLSFSQVFVVETHGDEARDGLITRVQAYEPYGPGGLVGIVLGAARVQRRLALARAHRSAH